MIRERKDKTIYHRDVFDGEGFVFPFRKNNWGVKKFFHTLFFQAVSLLLL